LLKNHLQTFYISAQHFKISSKKNEHNPTSFCSRSGGGLLGRASLWVPNLEWTHLACPQIVKSWDDDFDLQWKEKEFQSRFSAIKGSPCDRHQAKILVQEVSCQSKCFQADLKCNLYASSFESNDESKHSPSLQCSSYWIKKNLYKCV
jgi:hypothetical protein